MGVDLYTGLTYTWVNMVHCTLNSLQSLIEVVILFVLRDLVYVPMKGARNLLSELSI